MPPGRNRSRRSRDAPRKICTQPRPQFLSLGRAPHCRARFGLQLAEIFCVVAAPPPEVSGWSGRPDPLQFHRGPEKVKDHFKELLPPYTIRTVEATLEAYRSFNVHSVRCRKPAPRSNYRRGLGCPATFLPRTPAPAPARSPRTPRPVQSTAPVLSGTPHPAGSGCSPADS